MVSNNQTSLRSPGNATSRRGAMVILVLVCLVIVFVGAAFAIDVAYMHTTRAELRTATDAASRAGAETLGRTQDMNAAIQAAIDTAALNTVAGKPLILRRSDIQLGKNNRVGNRRFEFNPNSTEPDSVRVIGSRLAGSAGGPVPLFFAPLFGVSNFQPVMSSTSSATTRDIALVLDVSGSMNRDSGGETRLEALKNAVNVFIDEIQTSSPNTQMSLSVYSSSASRIHPLTENLEQIRTTVDGLNAGGFTAIGLGLLAGSDSLETDPNSRNFSAKTIVLMTDGNHNTDVSPVIAVETAVAREQTVHTITFSAGANQNLMRDVASLGGGRHEHADGNDELEEAFREIARTIAVMLIN